MELGLEFTVVFNNVTAQTDQDLLFYIWEKTEQFTNREAVGMIPFVGSSSDIIPQLAEKMEENLSALLSRLQQKRDK